MTRQDGVGVLPWMVSGSSAIAKATGKLMEFFDVVIWCQHGIFAAGTDLDIAFGLTHTVEKAAEIYVKVRSAGGNTEQAISAKNIHRLKEAFHMSVRQDFRHPDYSEDPEE